MKKQFKTFLLLWLGQFISQIGSGITSFGLAIFAYKITNMASVNGIIMLFAFLPNILLTPFAGVLADRYDRRILMILGDGLSAIGLLFILFFINSGNIAIWQICIGVGISSIFSSLLDPSYKATITDLLDEEQYTKASGLVQLASSSRYLISPIIAGFLMMNFDISLLLIIDILTIVVTIFTTFLVKKNLTLEKKMIGKNFISEFKIGFNALKENSGVLVLTLLTMVLTLCVGFIQILSTPVILEFTNSESMGMILSISAGGMLVSSILIGFIKLKNHRKNLSLSLFLLGLFMAGFGFKENSVWVCAFGFLLFSMLPIANASLDYLVRTNISNEFQGRIWGLIGIISQFGYVIAYSASGFLADYLFKPLLIEGGFLTDSVGKLIGVGSGRGAALLIILSGLMLSIFSIILYRLKSISNLENNGENYVFENNIQ